MKTLVITGGIGSGKSAVCRHFASKGIPVYDSDSRTRQLYDSDRDLVSRISRALGTDITGADGKVCRRKISSNGGILSRKGACHLLSWNQQ